LFKKLIFRFFIASDMGFCGRWLHGEFNPPNPGTSNRFDRLICAVSQRSYRIEKRTKEPKVKPSPQVTLFSESN